MLKKVAPFGSAIAVIGLGFAAWQLSDSGQTDKITGKGLSVARSEQYCSIEGMRQSLRQTFILLDGKLLRKADLATEFAERNGFIRDLVLSFANPKLALVSGLSAPRERITVLVAPSDGSPAQVVFSGCTPGLSADEEASSRKGNSSLEEFFTGDPLKQLEDDAKKFQLTLVGGLTAAARLGRDEPEPQTGALAATPIFSAIRASRGILEAPTGTVARYVIVTDLGSATFEDSEMPASPSKQGRDAGMKAGGDFGLSEVMVVLPDGVAPKGKDFLEGFLLAQGGQLVSYSSGKPMAGARAPTSIRYFEGQVAYPSGPEQMKLRIADDGKGSLSSSWLTLPRNNYTAIPLTGQISCSSPAICKVVSDDKGFAQVWSPQPGGEPEFDNKLPFGGMRHFSFEIQGKELKGEVSDPLVQIGDDSSRNSISLKATAQ